MGDTVEQGGEARGREKATKGREDPGEDGAVGCLTQRSYTTDTYIRVPRADRTNLMVIAENGVAKRLDRKADPQLDSGPDILDRLSAEKKL